MICRKTQDESLCPGSQNKHGFNVIVRVARLPQVLYKVNMVRITSEVRKGLMNPAMSSLSQSAAKDVEKGGLFWR